MSEDNNSPKSRPMLSEETRERYLGSIIIYFIISVVIFFVNKEGSIGDRILVSIILADFLYLVGCIILFLIPILGLFFSIIATVLILVFASTMYLDHKDSTIAILIAAIMFLIVPVLIIYRIIQLIRCD